MALQGPIPISFDQVFPHGAYAVGEVAQVDDFDQSTREKRVQAVDASTGLRLWAVRVMDPDPAARKGQGEVVVKVLADVQPVLPDAVAGLPFRPVEFSDLTVTPYLEERGNRARIAYSFKATGVRKPGKATAPAKDAS